LIIGRLTELSVSYRKLKIDGNPKDDKIRLDLSGEKIHWALCFSESGSCAWVKKHSISHCRVVNAIDNFEVSQTSF
jgi:hypothetical protein